MTTNYKILLLVRYAEKESLWSPLMVEKQMPNSNITIWEEFSTTNIDELKIKLKEVLETNSTSEIKIINEIDYSIIVNIDTQGGDTGAID